MLRPIPFVFAVFVAIALGGCSKPAESIAPPTAATPSRPDSPIEPCSLLTSEEVEAAMNEAFTETKDDRETTEGFTISQCFFALPTRENSVTLRLVQRADAATGRNPKQVWQETFARDLEEALKHRKGAQPEKVADLGDDAFWMGGPKAGGLYVLKGNRYFRIGLGGEASQAVKIEQSTKLARAILGRWPAE